ncbi:MAG TPA: ABC transporter permease [Gemmatimonadaceae bacterium]|nr:ABC transporter permease [Gemmatimonadaceae bacterium]
MPRSGRGGRQLKSFLWRASTREEVDADIGFHLDMLTRELMEQGLPESQARLEAERRFGDVTAIAAESRKLADERDRTVRRSEWRDELRQDLAFALRQLRRAPAFTAMASLTLALGFGATAAVFSAVYAVVLKPLPYPDAERVVTVRPTRRDEMSGGTVAEYFAIAERTTNAFERFAAMVQTGFTIRSGETPELTTGARVSADYFRVFGVDAVLGRTFNADDDVPGRDNVVIISHRAWQSRYNGDPGVLGRAILVDGAPRTVIGVMPASFELTSDFDELWVPLGLRRDDALRQGARYLDFRARLRRGVSMQQATAVAAQAIRAAAAADPELRSPLSEFGARLDPFIDDFVGDYRSLLLILLGAGGFVLLIGCTNVANLLIARGSVRARELSIRAALGAGRRRLLRQLITEAAVLALVGAAIGLLLAFGLLRAVLAVSPEGVPRLDQARVDLRVLSFTLLCAAVSTVIFGLVPSLRLTGANLERALRSGGRALRGGRDRLRAVLVGVEVALAMTLLVGAGLLIRSAVLLQQVEPGFDAEGVYTARVVLPQGQYSATSSILTFYDRLYRDANALPAVRSAALVSVVPLSGSNAEASVFTEQQSPDDPRPPSSNLRLVSAGYFGTMRIPLRAGRDISQRDNTSSPNVVVVNEALASLLWPGVSAREVLGRRINVMAPKRDQPLWWEVVGVVGNLKSAALSADVRPEFYIPVAQTPEMLWPYIQRSLVLVARTRGDAIDAATLERPVRALVASLDPNLAVADGRAMSDFLRRSHARSRFNMLVLGTLGGIALVLAVIGVYGVVSYFVSQRTQDIALRMALGATPATIWKYVAARGLAPLLAGIGIGVVLSLVTARLLESQLYHVKPTDPFTIGGTALLLLLVSIVAMYAPARRAIRVQPVVALSA